MEQIRSANGPKASSPNREGDADESRPQASLLPDTEGRVRQQRQNFWLRKTVLMAFALLFIACALALVGVSRYTTAQNGLPLSLSSSSYSWTYGPTAVLVIILALWRQVDYNCRSMQPWWEMARRPSSAARSVLLDYVSPFQPLVCVSALKNGHYAVVISTSTFLVLKLIILLSTTLFVVEPTWHLESVFFHYQNTFNVENMWNSPGDLLTVQDEAIRSRSRQADVSIWSYIATLNNATTKRLDDTNPGHVAYQSFSPLEFSSNVSSVSAIVDVFIPIVECEESTLSLTKTTFNEDDDNLYYKVSSPSCSSGDLEAMDLYCLSCVNEKRLYSVQPVDCTPQDNPDNMRSSGSPEPDIRYAVALSDLALSAAPDSSRYDNINIQRASATICKVGYGMASANATRDISSGQATLDENPLLSDFPRHLPNMTNHDLADILLANLYVASETLLVDRNITVQSQYAFSFFQLLAVQLKLSEENMDVILQRPLLPTLSTAIFEGISVEFAKKSLLVEDPDGEPFEAIAHVGENRLHLRRYTLWPMVSGFLLLSFLCSCLCLVVPDSEHQLNASGSIASYAAVLVNSPSLLEALRDTGHYRSSQLRRKLENLRFTVSSDRHGTKLMAFGSSRELPLPDSHRRKRKWLPLAARIPMVALSFILPLLTTFLLEILQSLSDKHHGLLDLDSSISATLSYAVRLTSTLLTVLIAALFNALDFSIAVFNPFSLLRSGSAMARGSLSFHLLGVSPFLVLIETLRLGQFGPAASNLSTLMGSFLTIAVSGLWLIGDPVETASMSTATVQKWDTSWLTKIHDDQGASTTLNIIRHGGATTPASIQGYDVLPKVSLKTTASLDRTNSVYEATVLRPILDCDSVLQDEINVDFKPRSVEVGKMGFSETFVDIIMTVNRTVSSTCSPHTEEREDTRDLTIKHTWSESKPGTLDGFLKQGLWIGQSWDLAVTPGESETACPSVAILFGKLGQFRVGNGPPTENNLTALFCSQKIQEVPATITYRGNPGNTDIDNVQLHSERATYLTNGTTTSTNLAFKMKEFLKSGLTKFSVPLESSPVDYDILFNHIIFGPQRTSPADILGPSNIGAFTEAITESFKEYLSHIIDLNFRSSNSEMTIQGTLLQQTTRLAIHKASKIILQSLLAVITVLSFVGFRLVKIRGTLPRNPCSIASTLAYLADSQLCDPTTGILPRDASLMNERELTQSLHGFAFSLGWWERSRDSNASRLASPSGEESSDLDTGNEQEVSKSTYFGIDVGHTNALGFSKKEKEGKRRGVTKSPCQSRIDAGWSSA